MHITKMNTYNTGMKSNKTMHEYVKEMGDVNINRENELVYRLELCQMLLYEGIPFVKLSRRLSGGLRDIIERNSTSVPEREVRDCIPVIHQAEVKKIISEIEPNQSICVCFDGTFKTIETFSRCERAIYIFNRGAIHVLCLSITSNSFHLRRCAAVNTSACKVLEGFLTESVFPICVCHSASIAGGEINLSCNIARVFISCWSLMLTRGEEKHE
jgi:hypothetical protein